MARFDSEACIFENPRVYQSVIDLSNLFCLSLDHISSLPPSNTNDVSVSFSYQMFHLPHFSRLHKKFPPFTDGYCLHKCLAITFLPRQLHGNFPHWNPCCLPSSYVVRMLLLLLLLLFYSTVVDKIKRLRRLVSILAL